jgi:1-phosphofructokinase
MSSSNVILFEVATVTLNPAIDRTVSVAGFEAGAVNRAELAGDRAGGKGVNVAAALAEQGHRVAALGFLGRDNDAIFAEHFAALGVADFCLRLPGATRTGIKIVDSRRGETTDLNFPGLTPGPAALADLLEQIEKLEAAWCVLAGSLPPGVPTDFYGQATRRLKARGVHVALDTSGAPLAEALAAGPDLVKPNVHELAALTGRDLPDEAAVVAAASTLVAGGVRLVAVSRGAEGAVLVSADEVIVARPPAVAVRSTVGAGDAMVAGLVAASLRGLPPAEAARLATAFSLHALSRAATDAKVDAAAVDPREAVEKFAARVEVRKRA